MKRLLKIGLLILAIVLMTSLSGGFVAPSTIRAFGDLAVDFHVGAGTPLFNVTTMAPGDSKSKNVDVQNNNTNPQLVGVKAVQTGGTGSNPKLETILDMAITDGAVPIYGSGSPTGAKTVLDFFNDSGAPDGVKLTFVNPSGHKTYAFKVTFPSTSGNEYQAKSVVFDLTFGSVEENRIVINEVYYRVDSNHGLDSPKDRGEGGKGKKLGLNDEWVELYNPTNHDISLKNWTITDNSGQSSIIHANKIIKAHGFALLSKDASTWRFWNRPNTQYVELGNQIGDGLDNVGDHLILRNAQGVEIDRMSWGNDSSGFTPPAINPLVSLGRSTTRLSPGLDTDTVSDWKSQNPPTPGN